MSEEDLNSSLPPSRFRLLVLGRQRMVMVNLPLAGELTIGQSPGSDVRIDDASVAQQHAVLRIGASTTLTDLGSGASTMVGSERIASGATANVAPGMVLVLGGIPMVIQTAGHSTRLRHVRSHDYFEGRIEDECARVEVTGGTFAVARVSFRREAAAIVEEAFTHVLRAMDVVAAYTPDEYEVLLLDVLPDAAERLMEEIQARALANGAAVAFGNASYPRDARTPEELLTVVAIALHGPRKRAPEIASGAMDRLRPLVERVAASSISVLILGETGVGKEVMARAIHALSPRSKGPLVSLNCAAVAESLLESELFGYERGAFTGAVQAKAGLLETAEGGTVFLDEIGETPLAVQAKLLRVIDQRVVTRVGGLSPKPIDVRFIAATNRDLEEEVDRGAFRQDLYFRLNGVSLAIPPLRERVSEIRPLAETFIAQACAELPAHPLPRLSREALAMLERYVWPGNIRELRNVVERAVLLCTGDTIELSHLPLDKMGRTLPPQRLSHPPVTRMSGVAPGAARSSWGPPPSSSAAPLTAGDRERIIDALEQCAGNQTKAAELLGISRRTLISRIEKHGLPRPKKSAE